MRTLYIFIYGFIVVQVGKKHNPQKSTFKGSDLMNELSATVCNYIYMRIIINFEFNIQGLVNLENLIFFPENHSLNVMITWDSFFFFLIRINL